MILPVCWDRSGKSVIAFVIELASSKSRHIRVWFNAQLIILRTVPSTINLLLFGLKQSNTLNFMKRKGRREYILQI